MQPKATFGFAGMTPQMLLAAGLKGVLATAGPGNLKKKNGLMEPVLREASGPL